MTDCGPNCEETLREIEAYLDGEVDATLRIRIETHIADCNPCMERAEFRRHLKVMISTKCAGDRRASGAAREDHAAAQGRPTRQADAPRVATDLGTVLGVWAHPDDDIYLSAGLMAAAVDAGSRVVYVTATRGEGGSMDEERWPPETMGARSANRSC